MGGSNLQLEHSFNSYQIYFKQLITQLLSFGLLDLDHFQTESIAEIFQVKN
jgi:hypothetical protein